MKTQITATRTITAPSHAGQLATARLMEVYSAKRNCVVYRWSDFCLSGEKMGWALLPNEYATVVNATRAAVKIGASVK